MTVQLFGKTDIGRVRASNQDAFSIQQLSPEIWLAVICDGMGGANAGNIASAVATEAVTEYVKRSFRPGLEAEDFVSLLQNAIRSANIAVYDWSRKNPDYKGMGTTIVAVISMENEFVVAHVGDSRAYLVGNEIRQLTKDHSIVQNMIENGQLTPEEAKSHPRKNVITRALGISEDVYADCDVFDFPSDHVLLLCTDGLSNYVEPGDIAKILTDAKTSQPADALIDAANQNGGGDNVTAVVVMHGQKG